jgi:hypothetical protein
MTMDQQRQSEKTMPGFNATASIGKLKHSYSSTVGYMREDGKVLPQYILRPVCPGIICFRVNGEIICTCI